MASLTYARQILLCISAIANYMFLAFSMLNNSGHGKRRKPAKKRNSIFQVTVLGLVALSYIVEGVMVATKEFDFARSQAHIFHPVSLLLVWCIVGIRLLGHKSGQYEVLGMSCTTFAFEVPILALSSFHRLRFLGPTLELVCQASRLFLLLCLLVATRQTWPRKRDASEEESQPFLRSGSQFEEHGYGTEPLLGQAPEEDDDGIATDSDDESDDDQEMRKTRHKRLRETGGWWGYLKDFSIFIPYLIPRKDLKVQACLVISLLCLICNRFLNILIPRQLGIVTDKVLAKESPFAALSIWLLLSIIYGDSGVKLIAALAKIPVEQFRSDRYQMPRSTTS